MSGTAVDLSSPQIIILKYSNCTGVAISRAGKVTMYTGDAETYVNGYSNLLWNAEVRGGGGTEMQDFGEGTQGCEGRTGIYCRRIQAYLGRPGHGDKGMDVGAT